jgi:hypothetical protein
MVCCTWKNHVFGLCGLWTLSKGPNRVGAPIILPEDGNIQFLKRCVFYKY